MNEEHVNALLAALSEQRNAALNQVVEATAKLVVANGRITQLERELEAATTLISESATVVEDKSNA